jgi:putative IMPACT (imprinted ancient) family translation regulator
LEQNVQKNPVTSEAEYKTIAAPVEAMFKERSSRFHAFAFPVRTEVDARARLKELRTQFPDATHICYAYRLGPRGDNWAAGDNGEPPGSAGRPILGRLMSAGVSDCLVAVVRWFGGKKLGVPGLIAAYKTAAEDVLKSAEFVEANVPK